MDNKNTSQERLDKSIEESKQASRELKEVNDRAEQFINSLKESNEKLPIMYVVKSREFVDRKPKTVYKIYSIDFTNEERSLLVINGKLVCRFNKISDISPADFKRLKLTVGLQNN